MGQRFCFDGFHFDSETGELRRNGLTTRLAHQPSQFLVALLERPGQVVTREELRSRLWSDDTFIDFDTGLNSLARKLREALSDSATSPRFVETLPRRGYRFISAVEPQHDVDKNVAPPARRMTWPWLAAFAIVVLSISTFAFYRADAKRYVDPEAHTYLVKGLAAFSRGTFEGLGDAVAYFEQATARQPDFAAAYAALAFTHMQFQFVGPLGPDAFIPKAETAARKAVALDRALPEAHGALGLVLRNQWNWHGALREFERAIELNPDYTEGHRMYSVTLSLFGRHAEALNAIRRARELDPLALTTALQHASVLMDTGEREQGVAELRKAIERFPERPRGHFRLGCMYLAQGAVDDARAALKEAVRLSGGDVRFVAHLAYAEAAADYDEEARRMLAGLLLRAQTRYVSPVSIALIYAELGDRQGAVEWIERAYRTRAPDIDRLFSEAGFESLHSDPAVRDLLARVGLRR